MRRGHVPAMRTLPVGIRTDARGGVTLLGVMTLTSVIALSAFTLELGQGYDAKAAWQGAADAAALGAANVYTTTRNDASLIAAATAVAAANGVAAADVTAEHLTNFSATVSDVVRVSIRRRVPLYLARIFSRAPTYDVTIVAIASLQTGSTPACILALASHADGIKLSGGTRIDAPDCGVASNSGISAVGGSTIVAKATTASEDTGVNGGSTISADTVTFGTAVSIRSGTITGKQIRKSNSTPDPLADHAGIAAARAGLGQYDAPATPSVPEGEDLTLGYYPTTMTFQGRTVQLVENVWTFPAGNYAIRKLNTQSLTLNILGPSTVTVSGSVTVGGGGKLVIGDGPVSISAPVSLGGGTSMTLGAGRHFLGAIRIEGGSSMTLGAGDLDVAGAIRVDGGGSRMTVGAGDVVIGNDEAGTAINLSGGSRLELGAGKFSANGSITTSGGSDLVFGATAEHRINGDLDLNGSSTFGSGFYLINGGFTNNTGGTMSGRDVTFILAGALTLSGGTTVNIAAPTAASPWGLTDILFDTATQADTVLSGGAQNEFSGAFHAPHSNLRASGGATMKGSCFMLIARTVTLSGGPTAGTNCKTIAGASGSGGGVSLIR